LLFQKKHLQICFFDVLNDLSLRLIGYPMQLLTRFQVHQKILRLPSYLRTFDRAPIFRRPASLNTCEVFGRQPNSRGPDFPMFVAAVPDRRISALTLQTNACVACISR
jgi:hypothetical protein